LERSPKGERPAIGDEASVRRFLALPGTSARERDEALFRAARWPGDPCILDSLVDAGANVNYHDNSGVTPLMNAIQVGNLVSAQWLMGKGADLNAIDRRGWSALMVATWYGRIEAVRLLINAGADPSVVSRDRRTALSIAVHQKQPDIAAILRQSQTRRVPHE